MPREATITHEQVAAVADAIKAEGGKPTLRAVRERLGSGSLATVQRLLSQWQQGQGRQAETSLALPPALQRAILDFMSQEMAAQRATLAAELADAQQVIADLVKESNDQGHIIKVYGDDLETEMQRSAERLGKIDLLNQELARVKAEALEAIEAAKAEAGKEREAAEGLRVELAKASLRLEGLPRLEAELEHLEGEVIVERNAKHHAETALASMQASYDAAKAEALEQRERGDRLSGEVEKWQDLLDRARTHFETLVQTERVARHDAEQKLARAEGVLEQIKAAKAEAGKVKGEK